MSIYIYYYSLHIIHLFIIISLLVLLCIQEGFSRRDDWFEEQLEGYLQIFKCRIYKNSVIRKGFDQAKNTSCSNALLSKLRTCDTKRNLVLVDMDYHPNLKDLPKLIKNHLPTLYTESPHMRKFLVMTKYKIGLDFIE